MRAAVRIAIVLLLAVVGATACTPPGEEVAITAPTPTPMLLPDRALMAAPPHLVLAGDGLEVPLLYDSKEWAVLADDGTLTGMVESVWPARAAGPCTPDQTVRSGTTFALEIDGAAPERLSLGAARQDASEQSPGLEVVDGTVVLDLAPGDWALGASGRWEPEGRASYRACITVVASDEERDDLVGDPPAGRLLVDGERLAFTPCSVWHGGTGRLVSRS